jgi:hypothetical protein
MSTAMDMRADPRKGVRTMWSWLRGTLSFTGRDIIDVQARSPVVGVHSVPARTPAVGARDSARTGTGGHAEAGIVLHFPIHGEALLVKLAELLRKRVANRGLERDPLLLMISRSPSPRLSIDRTAYIDFLADRSTYHFVIEAAPDAKVTLDTTDFDTVVRFVVQYVTDRISGSVALEAAS